MSNKPKYQPTSGSMDNRALHVTRNNDNVANISVGLMDIDNAIKYYFDNVIQLHIEEDGVQIPVPVIMGSPERWKSVQKDGFYRDKDGVLLCPLVMFRRTSMNKKRTITRNLDSNNPNIYQSFERKYTSRNNYDRFSILTNTRPQKEFYNVVVPDYMQINYECIIWTNYVEQMNKIQEAINYAESSYWGEPNKFNFYAVISEFSNNTEVTDGTERIIKSNFELSIHGYIVANSIQNEITQYNKRNFSFSKVMFNTDVSETITTGDEYQQPTISSGTFNSGAPNNLNAKLIYLQSRKSVTVTGDAITIPDTVTFTNQHFLPAPSGFPSTSVSNFSFFINGQYITQDAIISFIESSNNCILTFNTAILGYELRTNDYVTAIGKFA